jgi:DNA repair protein RadC
MNHSSLSNLELLIVLLGQKTAERLYEGALTPLFAPANSECAVHGRLDAAHELVKRWLAEQLQRTPVFKAPGTVRQYLQTLLACKEHEAFTVLFLDNRHRLINAEEMFRGTIDGTSVYPREIVRRSLHHNAAAVVLAHNHPSGVAEPSSADRAITARVRDALTLIDVRLLDHFIVGEATTVSFAETGLL